MANATAMARALTTGLQTGREKFSKERPETQYFEPGPLTLAWATNGINTLPGEEWDGLVEERTQFFDCIEKAIFYIAFLKQGGTKRLQIMYNANGKIVEVRQDAKRFATWPL